VTVRLSLTALKIECFMGLRQDYTEELYCRQVDEEIEAASTSMSRSG